MPRQSHMTHCLARQVHCRKYIAINIRLKYHTFYPPKYLHKMTYRLLRMKAHVLEDLLRLSVNLDGFIDNGAEVEAALVRLL